MSWRRHGERASLLLLCILSAVLYLDAYKRHPAHPRIGLETGWWGWFDQARYFASATAWWRGDLDPAQHWYMPGYSLLAAPFIGLVSVHAFAIVNLACLLASLVAFSLLARKLLPQLPGARLVGAAVFVAVTCGSSLLLDVWVVPWTTSGSTPLTLGFLLFLFLYLRDGGRGWHILLAGLCAGSILAFRPTDLLPLGCAGLLGLLLGAFQTAQPHRTILRAALWGGAGFALPAAVLAGLHMLVHGWQESGYMVVSGLIGFEWRVAAIRWVSLMLSPRPLFASGTSMMEAFPWMAAGLAGMAAFFVLPPQRVDRTVHATIVLAIVLHILLYLTYRDLHPEGLFQFWNYHYFKWVMPFLGLYGIGLAHGLLRYRESRLRMLGAGAATLCLLLPWRVEPQPIGPAIQARVGEDGRSMTLPLDLTDVRDGLLLRASGEGSTMYFGPHELRIAGRDYAYLADFRIFPRPGGMLLTPLRPLRAGEARILLREGVAFERDAGPVPVRQRVVPGIPCWLPLGLPACRPS